MLRVTAYKKTFSSNPVLEIPHLELEPAVYWLRGENGSGKTTFLKSVAGLIPFEGEIEIDAINLRKNRRAYTSFVNHAGAEPQYPAFLTGNDLVNFYLPAKKGGRDTVTKISRAFGMEHYLDNKTSSYSSGMAKKLCLLLAFIGQPKLILLDEPFTTLDTASASVLQELILETYSNGVLFIISSHQQLALPHEGLILQDKTITRG